MIVYEGQICPKCELGKLRLADGLEFHLTLDNVFFHCDICGATWIVDTDGSTRYLEFLNE